MVDRALALRSPETRGPGDDVVRATVSIPRATAGAVAGIVLHAGQDSTILPESAAATLESPASELPP